MAIDDSVSLPGTGPLAFASFSFDPHDPSEVVVPSTLIGQRGDQAWVTTIHAPGVEPGVMQSARIDSIAPRSHVSVNWREGSLSAPEWEKSVGRAVERINAGELDKVIKDKQGRIVADVLCGLHGHSGFGALDDTRHGPWTDNLPLGDESLLPPDQLGPHLNHPSRPASPVE